MKNQEQIEKRIEELRERLRLIEQEFEFFKENSNVSESFLQKLRTSALYLSRMINLLKWVSDEKETEVIRIL